MWRKENCSHNDPGLWLSGLSKTESAAAVAEVARVDASCSTCSLVHSFLAMLTIAQKRKYLPSLAQMKTIACWALTEPDYGTDASSVKTTATKVEGGWILDGQKRGIGNSTFADLLVICARNTITNQINGYIVKKAAAGLTVTKMESKSGLRIVQNGDEVLRKVFVPDDDRTEYRVNSFRDPNKVLAVSRVMVAWQPFGLSIGIHDMSQVPHGEETVWSTINSFRNQSTEACSYAREHSSNDSCWLASVQVVR